MKPIVERLLYIALATTVVGVMILLVLLVSAGQKLDQQLKYDQQQQQSRAAHTQQIIDQINAKSDAQTAYIRCIAAFFAQADRANMTLADLDSCRIDESGSTVSASQTIRTNPTTTTPSSNIGSPKSSGPATPTSKLSVTPAPSPKPSVDRQSNPLRSIIDLLTNLFR